MALPPRAPSARCEAAARAGDVGGRFETDGSFTGTYWKTMLENSADGNDEESVTRSAEHRPPSADEVAALRRIIEDVLSRA